MKVPLKVYVFIYRMQFLVYSFLVYEYEMILRTLFYSLLLSSTLF